MDCLGRSLVAGRPESFPLLCGESRAAEDDKWPLPLRVLFIATSTAALWALIVAGVLWMIG